MSTLNNELDPKIVATLLKLKDQKDINVDIPGLKLPLEPHQRVGVAYHALAERSLNLDFLGAGKTVTSIALDAKLRDMIRVQRSLVVCQGGKRWDWVKEYKRFTDIPVYVVDGNKNERVNAWLQAQAGDNVTIAHYESIRGDMLTTDSVQVDDRRKPDKINRPSNLLSMLKYDLIIFDEITIFKNFDTTLHQALQFLITKINPQYVVGLSATVIQKSLEDLHSIVDIIRPNLLGERRAFTDRYVIKQQFSTFVGRRKQRFEKVVGFKNEDELAQTMLPFYIRRVKESVYAGKLKHVAKVRHVTMTPAQAAAYKSVTASVDRGEGKQSMLTKFLDMEKICDTMTWFEGKGNDSAKVDDIMELLKGELQDEKVVIFSKHKKPLLHLAARLSSEKTPIPYIYFAGTDESGRAQDDKQRDALRDSFQNDPTVRIALVTVAAEMGYDFHAAHYMIFLNHIYNPARIDQLRGRIDRPIVQKSNFVCTIHYVTKDTFEESVIPRLHQEADLMKKVFGAENSFDALRGEIIHGLDNEQLYELIRHGRLKVQQDDFTRKS